MSSVLDNSTTNLPTTDVERIADAVAKRVRKGWRLLAAYRSTWRNYHPVLNR